MPPYYSYISGPFADPPLDARPCVRPRWFRWAGVVGAVALLSVFSLRGIQSGVGLKDTWLLVLLLCLLTLALSLPMLVFPWARRRAARVAAASGIGIVVGFVGFGLVLDANRARIAAARGPAQAAAHGVTLTGESVVEKEMIGPAASGDAR